MSPRRAKPNVRGEISSRRVSDQDIDVLRAVGVYEQVPYLDIGLEFRDVMKFDLIHVVILEVFVGNVYHSLADSGAKTPRKFVIRLDQYCVLFMGIIQRF